jgi:protoporphyrin/coproporphyrin ferrochelatase
MAYYRAVAGADAAAVSAPECIGVLLVNLGPPRGTRKYRKTWLRGAPMAVYSERLTMKIGALLQASFGDQVRVRLALTHGNPSIESAIQSLAEDNAKKLLALPLFPRQWLPTADSVFDQTTRVLRRWRWLPQTRIVNDYYYDPGSIDALARLNDDDNHARVLASVATNKLQGWTAGGAP